MVGPRAQLARSPGCGNIKKMGVIDVMVDPAIANALWRKDQGRMLAAEPRASPWLWRAGGRLARSAGSTRAKDIGCEL